MADAGLQVWGEHGFLQIDQNFKNMALAQKGTINGSTLVTYTGPNGTAPILVFVATYPNVVWYTYATRNGNQIQYYCNGVGEYYIFDIPPAAPVNGVGLQVFDTAGACVFDSQFRYFRPVGMATITESASMDGAAIPGITIPAGKKWGWVVSSPGYFLQNNYPSSNQRSQGTWALGPNSGGTGFRQLKKIINTYSGNVTPDKFTQLQVTFADMTGFTV